MTVVSIGIMLVRVCHGLVMMRVGMNCAGLDRISVFVLVMRIMGMLMLVIHGLVDVTVDVLLGKMKPQAERHQCGRNQEPGADVLVQEGDGEDGAKEGGHGVIRPSARRAEMA